ncbi:putative protein OS=Afipia felis OX=1035 GN=NCTC12722_03694 PE=4 SV=1 [Afipia felis]
MTSESGRADRDRQARLRAALRENLKRRKSQARGRSGRVIVTPEDDAVASSGESEGDVCPGER